MGPTTGGHGVETVVKAGQRAQAAARQVAGERAPECPVPTTGTPARPGAVRPVGVATIGRRTAAAARRGLRVAMRQTATDRRVAQMPVRVERVGREPATARVRAVRPGQTSELIERAGPGRPPIGGQRVPETTAGPALAPTGPPVGGVPIGPGRRAPQALTADEVAHRLDSTLEMTAGGRRPTVATVATPSGVRHAGVATREGRPFRVARIPVPPVATARPDRHRGAIAPEQRAPEGIGSPGRRAAPIGPTASREPSDPIEQRGPVRPGRVDAGSTAVQAATRPVRGSPPVAAPDGSTVPRAERRSVTAGLARRSVRPAHLSRGRRTSGTTRVPFAAPRVPPRAAPRARAVANRVVPHRPSVREVARRCRRAAEQARGHARPTPGARSFRRTSSASW